MRNGVEVSAGGAGTFFLSPRKINCRLEILEADLCRDFERIYDGMYFSL
jgi:hypothetical protein